MSNSTRNPYVRKQPKTPQKDQRWTLLFLGNRGRTITFKHFKSVVAAAVVILVVSAAIAGWFWYLYKGALVEISNHEKRIDNLKKAVLSLRNEKDILMARLVVAESRVEESLAKKTVAKKKPETVKPKEQVKKPVQQEDKKESGTTISVTADDFIVFHEPDINTLRVRYKIRNLGSREQPVSGRTVILLRDDDDDPINWLVLPKVPLKSGKPTGQYGRSFSIYNFRTMKFKAVNQSGPDKYKTAIVFVFSTTGDLLLEKTFAVGIQPLTDSAYNPQTAPTGRSTSPSPSSSQ